MVTTNSTLINNYRLKIRHALSVNKPVLQDDVTNTQNVDEAIINGVRDRPHLYDTSKSDYCDAAKRDNSFSAIGSRLNMTGEEVAKRWKALRDRFAREKHLTDASKKWRFLSQLTFLNDHIKCQKASVFPVDILDNNSDFEGETPSGNDVDDFGTAETAAQSSGDDNPHRGSPDCGSPVFPHNSSPPLKRQRTMDDEDIINLMKNVCQDINSSLCQQAKPTELDSELAFGITISHRLKRLSPKKSSLAQYLIQKVLYEVEFGE